MQGNGSHGNRLTTLASLLLLLPLLLVSTLSGAAPRRAAPQAAKPSGAAFPLREGTYWVYQAVVRWGTADSSAPHEKLMEWKMEVDRVIHRGSVLAAVVKGFPRDLDGSHGDTKPAESLIIESGRTKFYWIPPASFKTALAQIENPKNSLGSLTTGDNIFLDLPLAQGKKFCNMTGMIRTDGFYCWMAEEPEAAQLNGVKGLPSGDLTAFPVHFFTADNATSFDFVPGVGITRYSYQVHGTVTDTELHLVEFHPGSR
jgi:hypothetical protein